MNLIYIDDSKDDNSQTQRYCSFSALLIPEENWVESFAIVRDYRKYLKEKYGIFISKEFHASDFVAGRGRISDRVITKYQRAEIFKETLYVMTKLPEVRLICAADSKEQEARLFERLLNRINTTMKYSESRAILICDEGNNANYRKLVRRMGAYNPIPSQFGVWEETGKNWMNIPLENILEDPVFKDSKQSYFLQLVDFTSFALLREQNQIPSRNQYNIHKAFSILEPILVKEAFKKDPRGIIRGK